MRKKRTIHHKLRSFFLLVLPLFGLIACSAQGAEVPLAELEIEFFKIGSADSMLLSIGDQTVLIDTGEDEDGEEIVNYLEDQGIASIDYLIVTHFDKDHVGGADTVLNEIEVENVLVPDYTSTSGDYQEFLAALNTQGIEADALTETFYFTLDSAEFVVYPPESSSYDTENDYSLVVSVQYGANSFLFAGDAEEARLEELLEQGNLESTLLKVPHHGRLAANSVDFFNAVSPAYAIITSSDKNPEEAAVVEALESLGTEVFLTREGNVHAVSDGTALKVTQD